MALIECDECGAEVSSKAAACPKCGNPLAEPIAPPPPQAEQGFNYMFWIGLPVALVVAFLSIGYISYQAHGGDAAFAKERKDECVKELMSNVGHSTLGYADKQAYDAHVAEKCKEFDLPR